MRVEDDNALGALRKQQVCQDPVLRLKRDGQQVLLDGLGGGGGRGDLDARIATRSVMEPTAASSKVAENSRVCRSAGAIAYDLADGGQKAHVEHAVGLVQNQDLDLVQHAGALVDEVDQAAGVATRMSHPRLRALFWGCMTRRPPR